MKKLLSCLLILLLTLALVPAAAAEEEKIFILYNPVTPVMDGEITAEEWGEPDCVLEPGDSTKPEKFEYWFRYKGNALYIAVRVHTDAFKTGTHSVGGSYLVARVVQAKGANATYLGLISMDEEYKIHDSAVGSMNENGCGARVVGNTVEYEFSTKSYATYSDGERDYLSIQLDYHEPQNNAVFFREDLAFSDDTAAVAAPAETNPPAETDPPENPADSAAPADSDTAAAPADSDAAAPSSLPVIIGVAACAVIAAVIGAVLVKKKKK